MENTLKNIQKRLLGATGSDTKIPNPILGQKSEDAVDIKRMKEEKAQLEQRIHTQTQEIDDLTQGMYPIVGTYHSYIPHPKKLSQEKNDLQSIKSREDTIKVELF